MTEGNSKLNGQEPENIMMKLLLYLVAGIILSPQMLYGLVVNNKDGTWTLTSSHCEVMVNIAREDIPTGAILNLSYQGNELIGNDEEMFAIRAGSFYPGPGYANALNTNRIGLISHAFINQKGESMDLHTEVDFTLIDNRLLIRYSIETLDTTEFPDGLDVVSSLSLWDSITCYNHTGIGYSISTSDSSKDLRWSVIPILELKNSLSELWVVSRNPYWGLWYLDYILRSKTWILKSEVLKKLSSWSGPPAFSILGPEFKLEWEYEIVMGSANDNLLSALQSPLVYFSPFPNNHEQIITMMFDNIPFESPSPVGAPETWNVPESGYDSTAPISATMVRLLEDHPRMKQGWLVLCDYIRDSTWIANPEETRWWRVRGKYRDLLLSTEKFRTWLRDIENDNLTYGYEAQARLGSHGLHHTPSKYEPDYPLDTFGPGWEFEHYDPVGAESTFIRIEEIYDSLGLTNKSLRFFRPPGFKRTAPLVYSLLKHGCKLMDIDVHRSLTYNPLVYPIHSPGNRMWLISSTWAGDTPDDYNFMKSVLNRGEFVLTAGHPWAWYDRGADSAYEQIDQIFTTAEQDFPYLGYLFPDEFGDFMDELRDIHNINTTYMWCFGLLLSFTGTTSKGEALVVEFDPNSYQLDGDIWMDGKKLQSVDIRGSRIFITLPQSEEGLHTVMIPLIEGNLDFPEEEFGCFPNPASNKVHILFLAVPGQTVNLIIYNTLGQIVRRIDVEFEYSDRVCYTWDTTDDLGYLLPSGVYFIEVKGNTFRLTHKVVILR